ncbi:hypothetical protein DJ70_08000 [Halorubrum halodurans]|uniref:RNA polymerase sigma factor 70 region 4 type 2 domain-containing protein n=2 Tax=Halorubrum halodurans TaxID=1383851 RepID=A0A256IJA4_9EURY|nr:hypothetical protein DJ70_08000 [Halorubrum halodurans]
MDQRSAVRNRRRRRQYVPRRYSHHQGHEPLRRRQLHRKTRDSKQTPGPVTMQYSIADKIEMLAGADLLTERQAEAYVYREIEQLSRDDAAERMGISPSTLDDYRSDAAAKIQRAEGTLDVLETIQGQRETNS